MANVVHQQTNFSAGLLSPYLRGRFDLDKYGSGCQVLDNFLPLLQGGIKFRPGTAFEAESQATVSGGIRLVSFSPSSDKSYILEFSSVGLRVYDKNKDILSGSLTETDAYPYGSDDLSNLYFSEDGFVLRITLLDGSLPPYTITLDDDGGSLLSDFTLAKEVFTSEPFNSVKDNEDTVLTIAEEVQVQKLQSSGTTAFDLAPDGLPWSDAAWADLGATPAYVEYRKGNSWFLGRILDGNVVSGVPHPSTLTGTGYVYIDPVDSVISSIDASARLSYIDDSYYDTDHHIVRSDTLLFNKNQEGAWLRVTQNYTSLSDHSGTSYPTDPDKTHWVQISEYLGPVARAVDFITVVSTVSSSWFRNWSSGHPEAHKTAADEGSELKLGSVYQILAKSGDTYPHFWVSGPQEENWYKQVDWRDAFEYGMVGEQFTWANYAAVGGGGTAHLSNESTRKQVDEVVVDDTSVLIEGENLMTATGAISVIDNTTSDDTLLEHTARVYYEGPSGFSFGASDVGRFIHARLGDEQWVLLQITAAAATYVDVAVFGNIPKEDDTSEILEGGQSDVFKLSVWYSGNYPFTSEVYEQRLVFGGAPNQPEHIWMSHLEDKADFREVEDDNQVLRTTGIKYNLSGGTLNRITWLKTGPTLMVGTESSEWQVRPNNFGEGVSPTNIRISTETALGSSLSSLRIGSSIFFVERSRRSIREMSYDYQIDGWKTTDLNILSNLLFVNDPVVKIAYQQKPNSMLWVLTQGGYLFSLTYDKDQNFYAWSKHWTETESTQSVVVDIEVQGRAGLESSEDVLWLAVDRGGAAYSMETLGPDYQESDPSDNYKAGANFLDAHTVLSGVGDIPSAHKLTSGTLDVGSTYYILDYQAGDDFTNIGASANATGEKFTTTGDTPTTWTNASILSKKKQITTPSHLENTTVSVIIDGSYSGDVTLTSGAWDLPGSQNFDSHVTLGYAYTGRMETLPISIPGIEGPTYGRVKKLKDVWFYLYQSLGLSYGIQGVETTMASFRSTGDTMDRSPPLYTGFQDDNQLESGYDNTSSLVVEQTQPYPLTILSMGATISTNQ
jgi:hypothetical protein